MSPYEKAERTRFAAAIVGPFLLFMGVFVLSRFDALEYIMPAFFADAPLVLIAATFTLIAGLVLLAAHHHWSEPAAVAITLIAILTMLRGALLLLVPDLLSQILAIIVQARIVAPILGGLIAILGLWLSFIGWMTSSAPPDSR